MTKRFDRSGNKKLHMQTLGALTHIDYNYPGLCSYEQAASVLKQINPSIKGVEELFRRMAFNVIMVNQDDHVKNISFLMDKNGSWKLAPAYDITFSYDVNNRWLKAHQMLVNGKVDDIVVGDLIAAGKNMGLSAMKCNRIINEIENVINNKEKYFEKAGVREKTYNNLAKIIDAKNIRR